MKHSGRLFLLLRLFIILGFMIMPSGIRALVFPDDETGDSAMAGRYAQWSKNLIDDGYWAEALAALERASDFADASSDISYLLALARSHENKPRGMVLEALEMSLTVDSWKICNPEDARLLKAENLVALKAYSQALGELSKVSMGIREAELRLKALINYSPAEFKRYMADTLDRYPRETGPARIFFNYLKNEDSAGRNAGRDDLQLLDLLIRRLPVLLLKDPELAWMAAPFMRDSAEAGRLVLAYRAVNDPLPASLPAAMKLGLIDDESAVEELFDTSNMLVDISLIEEIWELLRREEERGVFRRNLSAFSGVLLEDADRDGIFETSAEYSRGMLRRSSYDPAQSGVPDLVMDFEAGDPRRALYLLPSENPGTPPPRREAKLLWERYPALEEAELDGAKFIPRPLDFHFSPVKFLDLWGSGVLFPKRDPLSPPLTRRVLVSQSLRVERPSLEFSGVLEVVELNQGIPVRAREYAGDLMISETEFLRGRPQLQRVDLDFDGHMETFRHFRRTYRQAELEELWDYKRDIDYVVENEE